MEVKVLGSTKMGYQIETDVALDFSAKMAGICYMPDNFETILDEPIENTQKRVNQTLKSGHHSVYDHVTFNLLLVGIPKILAMVLNNEGMYTTSEKSARYTKMNPSPREKVLYDKWYAILVDKITETYREKFYTYHLNKLKDEKKAEKATTTQIGKLAQENARYMISVFTPTTMAYTVSLRQVNYIRAWFEDFISEIHDYLPKSFALKLKESMKDFLEATKEMYVPNLDAKVKNRDISLFDKDVIPHRIDIFDEVYSTAYFGTFAQLAQAQRHRTLSYKMRFNSEKTFFYVPAILKNSQLLVDEWNRDIESVADVYPQGMFVEIWERGTYENFALKCMERLCGCAQLEIAVQTNETMEKYIEAVKDDDRVYNYLKPYSNGARCTFPCWKCASPCVWGAKEAFTRLI